MFELMKGDCLEKMKNIPDGSVDLVLTDPPYGTTNCKWDSVIPFDEMWEQLKRIIKTNGVIVLFGTEPFSSELRLSNLKYYKYDWKWLKNRPFNFLHCKNSPLKTYEDIIVFSNGKIKHKSQKDRMCYNPQGLKVLNKTINGVITKNSEFNLYRPSQQKEHLQEFTNYPTNVLNFKCCEEHLHPTQKPVDLLEYLIKTYTNEGETVLDFTMGSGSTGVACINTNRNFIGIELDDNYYNIALKRISEAEEEKDNE